MLKVVSAALLLLIASSCWADDEPDEDEPAIIPLAAYARIEIRPFELLEEDAEADRNLIAKEQMETVLKERLGDEFYAAKADAAEGAPFVTIDPMVDDIHFVRAGTRFLLGPFTRGTHVTVRLRITEQPSGRLLGEPTFEDGTNAVAAIVTFGGRDSSALTIVAETLADYLIRCRQMSEPLLPRVESQVP
jgi:hypothetical protein